MNKILVVFCLALLSPMTLLAAEGQPAAAEAKKAPAARKPAPKKAVVDEDVTLPPTVAHGVTGKQPPPPANKIDPVKPVSPLVTPKAALAPPEPPGGFPKSPQPDQPKGNIDPSKIVPATVYSYKDDKGIDMFADNLEAVPKQFRDKAKKVQR